MTERVTQQADPRPAGRLATSRFSLAGYALVLVLVAIYAYLLIRTAWLTDDAYITYRTIGNFISGYGLTWNVAERTQAYTHPLWMFLLSGMFCVTASIETSAFAASIGLSLAAILVFTFGVARTVWGAVLGLAILVFSKAFVEYSTSGLENPLSYLLLVLFVRLYLMDMEAAPRRLLHLSLLACLLVLNRMDLLLLAGPALAVAWWSQRSWKALGQVLLGFLPFVAWEVFSVIYYGFPFPNTAYAKLNTGIPAADLFRQGTHYFINSYEKDPVTLPAAGAALLAGLFTRRRKHIALAAGLALYGLYVLRIGGDFMGGRFFAVPLLAAVSILAGLPPARSTIFACAFAVPAVALLGLSGSRPSILSTSTYNVSKETQTDNFRIDDERAGYYRSTGLLRPGPRSGTPDFWTIPIAMEARNSPERILMGTPCVGMLGYYAGPGKYIVDVLALPDPLLARLPMPVGFWRIGHFQRYVPDGYIESLRSGRNELTDMQLREYYDRVRQICRGPIYSLARWQAILEMNLGRCEHLIDREYYRHPPLPIAFDEAPSILGPFVRDVGLRLGRSGARVSLAEPCHAASLQFNMMANKDCRILWPRGQAEPLVQTLPVRTRGLDLHEVAVPPEIQQTGFDRFLIEPDPTDQSCWIHSIRLLPPAPQSPAAR